MERNPIVLFDANVLYGQWLRDLLMWLGATFLLRPRWTERIEQEWTSNLLAHRPDLQPAQIERTKNRMNQVFPEARVVIPASAPSFALPDQDDVHVLQAAVVSQAKYLLTFNLRDFPRHVVEETGVIVIHPDKFLLQLLQQEPQEVRRTLRLLQEQKTRPPVSWDEMLRAFSKADLPKFSAALLVDDIEP